MSEETVRRVEPVDIGSSALCADKDLGNCMSILLVQAEYCDHGCSDLKRLPAKYR